MNRPKTQTENTLAAACNNCFADFLTIMAALEVIPDGMFFVLLFDDNLLTRISRCPITEF